MMTMIPKKMMTRVMMMLLPMMMMLLPFLPRSRLPLMLPLHLTHLKMMPFAAQWPHVAGEVRADVAVVDAPLLLGLPLPVGLDPDAPVRRLGELVHDAPPAVVTVALPPDSHPH